jgi:hypothetical protein
MSGAVLGRAVLELSTDQSKLRSGLTEARAETLRQTLEMKNAARIELRANLDRLKLDYNTALADARANKRKIEQETTFAFRVNLAQLQSDLRTAENEQKASLRRMQQQASASGGLGGLAGDLATGLGIGSGAALVQTGIQALGGALSAGKSAFIDYNSAIDNTRAQLLAFTRSSSETEKILADLRAEADKTPFTFQQLSGSIATLLPVSKQSGVALNDLIKLAETLAALNPQQGFEGAVVALSNAAAGQTQSLQERFNISREAITRFKEQGLSDIDAVRAALKQMGVDESLVGNLSLTFSGRLSTLTDALSGLAGRAGQPIFAGTKQAITDLTTFLSSPEVQKAGEQFTANLRAALADPDLIAGAQAIATEIGHIGSASADAAKHVAELGGTALGGTVRGAKGAADVLHGLGDVLDALDKQLTGTSDHADFFLDRLSSGQPPLTLYTVLDALKAIDDELNKPSFQKGLDDFLAKVTRAIGGAKIIDLDPNRIGFTPPPANQVAPPFRPDQPDRGLAPAPVSPPFRPDQADRTAQASASRAAAYRQGLADLHAYLQGFTSQDFDLFGKLKPQIEASFRRAFADLDPSQLAPGLGKLDGLTARITNDIDTIGHTSGATQDAIRGVFGASADEVIRLADAYGRAAQAADTYTQATLAAGAAQGNLAVVTASANAAIAAAQGALTAAQRAASANQAQFQNQIADLQQSLAGIDREAQSVARAYDDQLRGLQAVLTASQRASEEAQRQFAAQIEAAQKEQAAIQAAGAQHADAYAAVLANATDEFLRNKAAENEALDEQTRKILEAGQAYQEFARQATAADHAVRAADEREHQIQLDFDRRIQAARNAGQPGQAAALERERDRVLARERQNSQVTRDEAVVAGDKAGDARTPLEAAARAQAETDKVAADAAGKRVAEIQDQAKQRAEADRQAQQAISDQIAAVQEEARVAAQGFADRKQAVADSIAQVQERARQQKIADDAAIRAATQTLTVVKNIETARIAAAQQGATNAQNAANAAKDEYNAQLLALDAMNKRNAALDDYIKKWKDFVDYLKQQNIPVPQFFGAPASTQVQSPVPGNVPETPGGKPQLPPGAPPPPPAPGGPDNPGGPGFFGRVPLPTYTAPAAPTAYYRAPVPPSLSVASYTAGLAATPAPNGAVTVHLLEHATINASDRQEVQDFFDKAKEQLVDEIFGIGLNSFETARRGSVVDGWRRG